MGLSRSSHPAAPSSSPSQGEYGVCSPRAAQAELRGLCPPALALCVPELCRSAGPPGRLAVAGNSVWLRPQAKDGEAKGTERPDTAGGTSKALGTRREY